MNDDGTSVTPLPPQQRRVRWYHVAVLVVALGVAGASLAFMLGQQSDRDDATTSLHRTERDLTREHDAVAASNAALAAARTRAQTRLGTFRTLLNTQRSMAALTPQGVDASRTMQQLSVARSIAELNSTAVPHSDDIARQFTDLANTLGPQLAAAMSDAT